MQPGIGTNDIARFSDNNPVRRLGASTKRIQNGFLAFLVFISSFVLFEPAPYDLVMVFAVVAWLILGMRIPRSVTPLLLMFILFAVGGVISSFQIPDHTRGLIYVGVTFYLSISAVFFAIIISDDSKRLNIIFNAWLVSAVVTSILGIIGYFQISGFESFVRDSRARGAFEDANVFAPFLIIPCLYLVYKIINGSIPGFLIRSGCFLILVLALLLAFSRAAWGLMAVSMITYFFVLFIDEVRPAMRLKYILIGLFGSAAVAIAIIGAIQIEVISELLQDRAKLVQPYDGGESGRFGRHMIGLNTVLENPFGIAPLHFGFLNNEDIHNGFLKAGLAYGWIGIFCWMGILATTLFGGAKLLFRDRPWKPYLQICWIVFFWHIVMSYIIDVDHWRHFYLMVGIIWGCMILEIRWQLTQRAQQQTNAAMQKSSEVPNN